MGKKTKTTKAPKQKETRLKIVKEKNEKKKEILCFPTK